MIARVSMRLLHTYLKLVLLLMTSIALPVDADYYPLPLTFWPSPAAPSLSQSVVTDIYQDSTGAMWFSTQEGLNRYDGKRVENFVPNIAAADGLAGGTILGAKEDNFKQLWVITQTAVQSYDKAKKTFTTAKPFRDNILGIYDFQLDSQGRIWLALENEIAVYLPLSDQLITFPLPLMQPASNNFSMKITVDSDGGIFAA